MEIGLLSISSLVFITNIASAVYNQYYVYSFLFLCLTIISVIFHSTHDPIVNILDKICIFLVVVYGGYVFYNRNPPKNQSFLILSSFVAVLFLYCYGYMINNYCYHPDQCIANQYHSLLQLISSIGHHLILL